MVLHEDPGGDRGEGRVGIHEEDQIAGRRFGTDPAAPRVARPVVGPGGRLHDQVVADPRAGFLAGPVGGGVVDHQDVGHRVGLGADGREAAGQRRDRVARRDDDRKRRRRVVRCSDRRDTVAATGDPDREDVGQGVADERRRNDDRHRPRAVGRDLALLGHEHHQPGADDGHQRRVSRPARSAAWARRRGPSRPGGRGNDRERGDDGGRRMGAGVGRVDRRRAPRWPHPPRHGQRRGSSPAAGRTAPSRGRPARRGTRGSPSRPPRRDRPIATPAARTVRACGPSRSVRPGSPFASRRGRLPGIASCSSRRPTRRARAVGPRAGRRRGRPSSRLAANGIASRRPVTSWSAIGRSRRRIGGAASATTSATARSRHTATATPPASARTTRNGRVTTTSAIRVVRASGHPGRRPADGCRAGRDAAARRAP